jgi:hypothetical protein
MWNALQIGASHELLLHAPPNFGVERVESVQSPFHLLDELQLLARPCQRCVQFGEGLPGALRHAVGLVERAKLLENGLNLILDRWRVDREPGDILAGRLECCAIGGELTAQLRRRRPRRVDVFELAP